ncbi:mucin-2-like [Oncorhynchus kisutch]|uniref:mucin-2-like n=1 Tax=Oncorhynchus kisutch TaxID=8019 RepID=UPI0012DCD993|nr:mucin-2-like [Oncorhynchus kisutch]
MSSHNTHPDNNNNNNNSSVDHDSCTHYYNLNFDSSIYLKNNNSAFYYNSNLYSYINLNRNVTCNPSVGLICKNNEQGLQQKCFDYEIRVKCCQCPPTTHIPTTITTTTVLSTTTPTPTTTILTSTAPSTTKTTTLPSTTTPTSTPTSTSTGVSTTQCRGEESCVWSDWINLGQPTSGSEGGDNESIKNIIASGYHVCSAPEAVECRAKQYPGLQISQLGQDVTCNPSVGLICKNNEQGLQQKCFDYEIRVKCCQCRPTTHIPTTTTTTTTVLSTTTPAPTTTILTSTAPSTTKTTTLPSTTTPTSTPTSTSTGASTTQCRGEESCVWSDWINLGQPTSGSEGGDNESIKNIIASGYHVCSSVDHDSCTHYYNLNFDSSIYHKNNNSAFYYNSNLYSYINLNRSINYPVQG